MDQFLPSVQSALKPIKTQRISIAELRNVVHKAVFQEQHWLYTAYSIYPVYIHICKLKNTNILGQKSYSYCKDKCGYSAALCVSYSFLHTQGQSLTCSCNYSRLMTDLFAY